LTLEAPTASQNNLDQPVQKKEASAEILKHPETVDDFIRNFFVQKGLQKSLYSFQVITSGLSNQE
jgi:hypothetical protein